MLLMPWNRPLSKAERKGKEKDWGLWSLVTWRPGRSNCGVTVECVPTTIGSAGPNFERSLPDATHGNCHLLLALRPTIERLTAFAEFIERCAARIVFGFRPIDSVCLQPVVLSINGAIASEHGIEARRPTAQECRVRRFTLVRRIVPKSAIVLRHLPTFRFSVIHSLPSAIRLEEAIVPDSFWSFAEPCVEPAPPTDPNAILSAIAAALIRLVGMFVLAPWCGRGACLPTLDIAAPEAEKA